MIKLTINVEVETEEAIGPALDEIMDRLDDHYTNGAVKHDGCEFTFTVSKFDKAGKNEKT